MTRFRWALACALVVVAVVGAHGAAAEEAAKTDDKAASSQESEYSPAKAERRIEQILDCPLKSPLEAVEEPLNQLMQRISEEYEIPVVIDVSALEAAAASPDAPVTVTLNRVTLRSALDLMLRQIEDLTYIVDNEVLQITTKDQADQRLQVAVYKVDDLVRLDDSNSPASPDSYDFDSLIEILTSSVEHDTWQENGTGEGEIHPYAPGMLIVSQSPTVHSQIERVLADMRRVKGDIESTSPTAGVGEVKPITRGIAIKEESVGGTDAGREMVRNAIVQSVDWGDQKGDSADHFLYVLPQRVIVRHLPHVVRQVERVMAEMGAKAESEAPRGRIVGGAPEQQRGGF